MIILRQKQYTSLGRKINAKIGRLRVNAANYLYKQSRINDIKASKIVNKVGAQKLKTKADLDPNSGYRFGEYLTDAVESNFKVPVVQGNSFYLSRDNSKMVVDPTSKFYGPSVAHEFGHFIIDSNRYKDKSVIKTKRKLDKFLPKYRELTEPTSNVKLKDIPTILKGNRLMLKNEKNASNIGMKTLKSLGASKEELKFAKDHLDSAEKTYKFGNRSRVLKGLGNMINLKGRLQYRNMYDSRDKKIYGFGFRRPVNMTKFDVERRINWRRKNNK